MSTTFIHVWPRDKAEWNVHVQEGYSDTAIIRLETEHDTLNLFFPPDRKGMYPALRNLKDLLEGFLDWYEPPSVEEEETKEEVTP